MQPVNKKHQVYNDGVVEIGTVKPTYDDANKKTGEEFENDSKLFFAEMNKRDEDFVFANSIGCTLDKKIKVPKRDINSKQKAKINDIIYSIYKIDADEINTYLYLQAVKL